MRQVEHLPKPGLIIYANLINLWSSCGLGEREDLRLTI